MALQFNNLNLNFDLEKIMGYDTPISIKKGYDENLQDSYVLEVADNSYFYASQFERDEDYDNLTVEFPAGQ